MNNGFNEHPRSKDFNFPLFRCDVEYIINYYLYVEWRVHRNKHKLGMSHILVTQWIKLLHIFSPRRNKKNARYTGDEVRIAEAFGFGAPACTQFSLPHLDPLELTGLAVSRRQAIADKNCLIFLPAEFPCTRAQNLRLLREYMIALKENGKNIQIEEMRILIDELESATPYREEALKNSACTAQLQLLGFGDLTSKR